MYRGFYVNCRLFLSDFSEICIFFDRLSKNTDMSNFTKIRPVGPQLFHADERTDIQTRRI